MDKQKREIEVTIGGAVVLLLIGGSLGLWGGQNLKREKQSHRPAAAPAQPKVTEHTLGQGQLLVIDVAAPMSDIPSMLEVRRCFVWRDFQQLGSSISCDQKAELAGDAP